MTTKVQKINEQLNTPSDCLIDITAMYDNDRYFYHIKKKAGKTRLTYHKGGQKGSRCIDVDESYCPNPAALYIGNVAGGYAIDETDIVFLHIVEARDVLFFKERKEGDDVGDENDN